MKTKLKIKLSIISIAVLILNILLFPLATPTLIIFLPISKMI